jgi:PPP family 3-phenylpropionic acid transporter
MNGNRFIPCFVFSNIFLAIVAPYIPILVRDLGYNPLWVGILLSIFEGAGIAGPFLLGYWADKTGNYRSSLILTCVLPALVTIPLITWVHPVLTAVFLFFIAFGLRSLVSLVDAITTVQIGITGNYGRLRAWGSISFIIMTLFFHHTPFMRPENAGTIDFWLLIITSSCLIPVLILKSSDLKVSAQPVVNDETAGKTSRKPSATPAYIFCGYSVIFLSRFGLQAIITYMSLYMIEIVEWDAVGLIWALAAVSEVPFMFMAKYLIMRFGSMPLLGISALGVCVRLLMLAFLPFKPWIVVSSLLHSVCFGIYHPAAIHFVTSLYPADKRGTGMSTYMIMGTGLPAILGTLIGGAVIQGMGYTTLFVSYAVVSGIAVLIYLVLRIKKARGF